MEIGKPLAVVPGKISAPLKNVGSEMYLEARIS
jgi:hypothetical protein